MREAKRNSKFVKNDEQWHNLFIDDALTYWAPEYSRQTTTIHLSDFNIEKEFYFSLDFKGLFQR